MFNKVIIVGNLTRDIELKYAPSGTAIGSTYMKGRKRFSILECKRCTDVFHRRTDNKNKDYCKRCASLNREVELKKLPNKINGVLVIECLGMNKDKTPKRIAIFRCKCGNRFTGRVNNVKTGQLYSCGCAKGKHGITHGDSKSTLYKKWGSMINRCENENDKRNFRLYGARGIIVCTEWRESYEAFRSWAINNGYDESLSIDRIDNDGNYEPSNCQWIPILENQQKEKLLNSKDEYKICALYKTKLHTCRSLADKFGVSKYTISDRLMKNGVLVEKNRRLKRGSNVA